MVDVRLNALVSVQGRFLLPGKYRGIADAAGVSVNRVKEWISMQSDPTPEQYDMIVKAAEIRVAKMVKALDAMRSIER